MSPKPYNLELAGEAVIARFARPQTVLSWAAANGAWHRTSEVVWLPPGKINLRARLHSLGLAAAVAFEKVGDFTESDGVLGTPNAILVCHSSPLTPEQALQYLCAAARAYPAESVALAWPHA